MKKLLLLVIAITMAITLNSQETRNNSVRYSLKCIYQLVSVNRVGIDSVARTCHNGVYDNEQFLFTAISSNSEEFFAFEIQNQTQHSLKIIWDNAAYVGADATSDGLVHGFKQIDKNQSQLPTVIAPSTTYRDTMFPKGQVDYKANRWVSTNKKTFYSKDEVYKYIQDNKTIQILLPIESNGTVTEYIFTFNVADTEVGEIICNIEGEKIVNQQLHYNRGEYTIGEVSMPYNKDQIKCLLYNTGNHECLKLLDKAISKRKAIRPLSIVGPIGFVIGVGVIASGADKTTKSTLIGGALAIGGGAMFISSFVLRQQSNHILEKLPEYYKPYTKSIDIGFTQNGFGATYRF